MEVRLAHSAFSPDSELAQFSRDLTSEGAVVSFVGLARPRSGDGGKVERLILDHHPRMTIRSLEQIRDSALERFAVSSLRIVHRCGDIAPGEAIVFVAAASAHRRAAFEAADYVMDRLKTDAVFWKREDTDQGSSWIEPRESDYAARQRWSETCPE